MPKLLNDIRNYPNNSGTAQPERYNAVLMGKKFSIIERQVADYIVFAHKLSGYLKYYDKNDYEHAAGNWQNFLNGDVSYHLASLVASRPISWSETWQELTETIEGPINEEKHKRFFSWRVGFLYTIIGRLVDVYLHSRNLPVWQKDLQALFATANLPIIFELLQNYHDKARDLFAKEAGTYVYKDLETEEWEKVVSVIDINRLELKGALFAEKPFNGFDKINFENNATLVQKISTVTEYLDELAQQLLRLYTRVHANAVINLEKSLESFDEHQPHVALFYAFLKLSDLHRNEINSLLLKHLDYYYRQVLAVKPKQYQPSQAYVCFEPAKNVNEFLIKSGNRLSAGKDAAAKDIFFTTQQDIIVNKAKVSEIRSFTVLNNQGSTANERILAKENAGIFACTVANSMDGKGKPMKPGQSWHPFAVSTSVMSCDAAIGLSFYSALLHETPAAKEGNKFSFTIVLNSALGLESFDQFVGQFCIVKIKTEKGAEELSLDSHNFTSSTLTFNITVSEKITITKDSPNVTIVFGKNDTALTENFFPVITALQNCHVASLSVTLISQTIPVTKVKTVTGETDLSAAFPAFGGVPKAGSSFTIVEPLLLNRKVSQLIAKIEWASATERGFGLSLDFTGRGTAASIYVTKGVPESNLNFLDGLSSNIIESADLKVKLQNDLGHLNYGREVANAAIAAQNGELKNHVVTELRKIFSKLNDISDNDNENESGRSYLERKGKGGAKAEAAELTERIKDMLDFKMPDAPYTPMIKSISLTCSVEEAIHHDNVFYQNPFGYKKVNSSNYKLVPSIEFEGEVYFGFNDLTSQQNATLLIQAEEGTADPTLPDPEVKWQYLINNEWQPFDSSQLKDGTKGLIQSGIVSFVTPDFENLYSTVLPKGLFWIRAAVPFNHSKAVCRIFSVHTQAVEARFTDYGNDRSVLGQNFPAGTISNVFPKQAAIKKVIQPFASFGGSKEEESDKLYSRTSERLRHKNRAISAWDYEHIIANAFPEIYKVKVLNHAAVLVEQDKKTIISKPGEIIILVTGTSAASSALYEPQVSKAKITAISEYIKTLSSPFAKIMVMNPLFEKVSVSVSVIFTTDIKDEKFYENKLDEDIKRFLSPWAFDSSITPEFGGAVYRAAVLDFIEELPYVDFIEALELHHMGSLTGDVAVATSPASVIISAGAHTVSGKLQTEIYSMQNDQSLV